MMDDMAIVQLAISFAIAIATFIVMGVIVGVAARKGFDPVTRLVDVFAPLPSIPPTSDVGAAAVDAAA